MSAIQLFKSQKTLINKKNPNKECYKRLADTFAFTRTEINKQRYLKPARKKC